MARSSHARCRVLAAIDPCSPWASASLADTVLETAATMARAWRGELYAVHAWTAEGEALLRRHVSHDSLVDYVEEARRRTEQQLSEFFSRFADLHPSPTLLIIHGRAVDVIPAVVASRRITVTVVGSSSLNRPLFRLVGDTATRLVDRLACPVVVVTSPFAPPTDEIPRAVALRGGR